MADTRHEGGWFDADDPEYLATRPDDRVSYSTLHAILPNRGGCEQKAIHRHTTKTVPSDDMRFGTLVDILLLTPDKEKDLIRICDGVGDSGTWSAKYKRETIEPLEAEGFICIKEKDLQPARECVASVLEYHDGEIAEQFNLGPNKDPGRDTRTQQKAWYWEGEQAVSLRTDWTETHNGVIDVMDLKTTSDPSPRAFRGQIDSLGYDIQAAKYMRAASWIGGDVPGLVGGFWWLAVKNKPPYTPAVYQMDAMYLQYAINEYLAAVKRWQLCKHLALNEAGGYTDGTGLIEKPAWR
jgi:hypothetical protein